MTANWCQHGFHIPEFPRELTALRCTSCYPERPPSVPEEEWGDWVAFGWTNTIKNVVMSRGWITVRGDADAITGMKSGSVRREQVEDLMADLRAHLLARREVLTKVATAGLAPSFIPLEWGSVAMRAYVKQTLQRRLIDIQQRSSEWQVQYHTDPFVQITDHETDTGDPNDLDISSAPTAQTASDIGGTKLQQGAGLNQQMRLGDPSLTVPSHTLRRIDAARAWARIGKRERETLLARAAGEQWADVAGILGTTEKTAYRRVKAAQEAVREVLA